MAMFTSSGPRSTSSSPSRQAGLRSLSGTTGVAIGFLQNAPYRL